MVKMGVNKEGESTYFGLKSSGRTMRREGRSIIIVCIDEMDAVKIYESLKTRFIMSQMTVQLRAGGINLHRMNFNPKRGYRS